MSKRHEEKEEAMKFLNVDVLAIGYMDIKKYKKCIVLIEDRPEHLNKLNEIPASQRIVEIGYLSFNCTYSLFQNCLVAEYYNKISFLKVYGF